jgi:hypothetical protein
MSKRLPKVSTKSRSAVRASRAKKADKALVFTKADLDRQRRAVQRFLALPTVTVGDAKASETGFIQKKPSFLASGPSARQV